MGAMPTTNPQDHVDGEEPHDDHDDGLQRDPEDHDGVTNRTQARVHVAHRGHDATATLQKEPGQVGGHEGPGPKAFRQLRMLRAKVLDQHSQRRV